MAFEFLIEMDLRNVGFYGGRELREDALSQGKTSSKLNPYLSSGPGFKVGPHFREANALTATQSLVVIEILTWLSIP